MEPPGQGRSMTFHLLLTQSDKMSSGPREEEKGEERLRQETCWWDKDLPGPCFLSTLSEGGRAQDYVAVVLPCLNWNFCHLPTQPVNLSHFVLHCPLNLLSLPLFKNLYILNFKSPDFRCLLRQLWSGHAGLTSPCGHDLVSLSTEQYSPFPWVIVIFLNFVALWTSEPWFPMSNQATG